MKRRGFTLMELLVASIVVAIVSLALAGAFAYGVSYQGRAESSRERELEKTQFEDSIRSLLEDATTSTDAGDTSLYFLAGLDATGAEERLTFVTSPPRLSGAQIESQNDFETQNSDFGPQGGPKEISIGMTPVGQTNVTSGLFVREQRPADGDSTQGGTERVIQPNVTEIQWEFFDGLNWQTVWDTAQTNRRIPAAVRVTYQLGDDETRHVFVVRLYKSDVTPLNPVTITTGGTTP